MEKHADELQKRSDTALLGAIRNDRSGQATKKTARTDGEVQYQARDEYDPETATIKKQIENSKHLLNEMEPAADKTVPYFGKGQKDAAARWAIAELQRKGYHVDKQGYGIIYFDKNDIDAAARYADTPAEKGALALIYDVLKRGKEIGRHEDHDKRGKKTITFGAPVVLNGIRGNMAVVVNMRSNHFYAERIVLPDGSAFILPEKKNAPQELPRGVVQKDSLAKATSGGSNNSIREESEKSNTKLQERDFMPDDRELLLEAAEGGQGGAELQEYSKKAQKLEEHRRRLQRLQEAVESAEGLERDNHGEAPEDGEEHPERGGGPSEDGGHAAAQAGAGEGNGRLAVSCRLPLHECAVFGFV